MNISVEISIADELRRAPARAVDRDAIVYIVANGYDRARCAAHDLGLNINDRSRVRVIDTSQMIKPLCGVYLLEDQLHYAEGAGAGRYWHHAEAEIHRSLAKRRPA